MGETRKVYSVAELNRKARIVLEGGIGEVWVEGELSRLTLHSSGHWYFTIKDESASASCAMFVRDNRLVDFQPKDGKRVRIFARPSLYEVNGRFQLIASKMEDAGKGDLQEQFEKLKAKLQAEGLFDPEHKKKLPLLPRKIGVVTSPTGAAIRDILQVLRRRFPNLQVLIAPVRVQGAGAEKGIAKAIDYLNTRDDIDVLIVGRGGGSLEDLWCFNEEEVARAIYRSKIPVISAVGHEIDFTISDMVADLRAPTPSAAAELVVPRKSDLEETLNRYLRRLQNALRAMERDFRVRLTRAAQSYVFKEPENLLRNYRQQLLSTQNRMANLLRIGLQQEARKLDGQKARLRPALENGLRQRTQRLDELDMRLHHTIERQVEQTHQRLTQLKSQLHMLNPLAVLGRGYSLTTRSDGSVIRSATEVQPGDLLLTRLAEGHILSEVKESADSGTDE